MAPRGSLWEAYTSRTTQALDKFLGQFPEHGHERNSITAAFEGSQMATHDWWNKFVSGESSETPVRPGEQPAAAALADEMDVDESEPVKPGTVPLQKRLSHLVDVKKLDKLMSHFVERGCEEDARRLDDL
eukprot:6972592-Karenia_brevis.AAC.1